MPPTIQSLVIRVDNNSGSFAFSYSPQNQIDVPSTETNNIVLALSSGNNTPVLSFASPAIIWVDNDNPINSISTPVPFTVTGSASSVTISDNNTTNSNQGTFAFKVNILANGIMLQSPDPTIINEGATGPVDRTE